MVLHWATSNSRNWGSWSWSVPQLVCPTHALFEASASFRYLLRKGGDLTAFRLRPVPHSRCQSNMYNLLNQISVQGLASTLNICKKCWFQSLQVLWHYRSRISCIDEFLGWLIYFLVWCPYVRCFLNADMPCHAWFDKNIFLFGAEGIFPSCGWIYTSFSKQYRSYSQSLHLDTNHPLFHL